ncbi:uncharacterized protein TRAVEDRAFT_28774 [Trametes versicolor FP-101664 SS1]|uniref:uncharacterized protein n=1 Tax=Trametes versicolor (strain FP-101664) TaxID=717944 RepID=UPI0004621C50|nr:uncharacterized protein TRAVEDRAFT_28774 [Trametes versicolor FP-101664 SS1]EIW59756.1 hypothetical protein TRAVEDRAFT_28774 [Trametes versicolor FP-101664 SS1]
MFKQRALCSGYGVLLPLDRGAVHACVGGCYSPQDADLARRCSFLWDSERNDAHPRTTVHPLSEYQSRRDQDFLLCRAIS